MMTESLCTVFTILAVLLALVIGGRAESTLYYDSALERALLTPPPAKACDAEGTEL
jgi:hypothetical protein